MNGLQFSLTSLPEHNTAMAPIPYSSQYPLEHLTSESDVEQGDSVGFSALSYEALCCHGCNDCHHPIVRAWYLDDGVLAGPKSYVLHALSIFVDAGSIFGIIINLSKCELFSHNDVYFFFQTAFLQNQPSYSLNLD